MRTPEQQQIANALSQWLVECDKVSDQARHLRQAMVAYADSTGSAPTTQLLELESQRSRADALARDLMHLIRAMKQQA
jgi:hypothetical protein